MPTFDIPKPSLSDLPKVAAPATRTFYAGAGFADLAVDTVKGYLTTLTGTVTEKVADYSSEVTEAFAGYQKGVSAKLSDVQRSAGAIDPSALSASARAKISEQVEAIGADAKARRAQVGERVAGLQSLPGKAGAYAVETTSSAVGAYGVLVKRGESVVARLRGEEPTVETATEAAPSTTSAKNGTKTGTAKTSTAKSGAAKTASAKTSAAKPSTTKTSTAKTTSAKTSAAKTGTAKTGTAKTSAAKTGTAKTGAAKSATAKRAPAKKATPAKATSPAKPTNAETPAQATPAKPTPAKPTPAKATPAKPTASAVPADKPADKQAEKPNSQQALIPEPTATTEAEPAPKADNPTQQPEA
ncbi:hypothetical protein [Nocardioides insulae]|uniref:hypothetical protein n=1 Tax=Nocardioides insulae TaxID=394734 RepID=UPI0004135F7D|nr:hypothetical protein [Nocardioides insulae]